MARTVPMDPLFLRFQLALAGRYSIDRELGRGGMGIVYLAREVHLDRLVAIKLLPPDRADQPALRERFLREARTAAKLSHPNIIPIHAVEETGGFVYYVMAFIDGETLAHRVRTRGPVSASEGARVMREAAWALAHAHAQGLVHRDVKPDNILIEAASGRVLVADFGIAAALTEASEDGASGTPEVMSPEQALGGRIDGRSDIYGLGATAFYAFAGRYPFEGATSTEVLARQVTAPAPTLASLGITVPRKLASLIDRCLAKEPGQRPDGAQALADQLGVALEQRRELPAALRAFVKRSGRLNGSGSLLGALLVSPVSIAVGVQFGVAAGFATFVGGLTVVPFGYCVRVARRMLLLGFDHADVAPAFNQELEQAREELTVERLAGPSALETASRITVKALAVASGATMFAAAFFPNHEVLGPFAGLALGTFSATIFAGIGHLALAQRHRDVDSEVWAKVWTGRIGRWAFRVAGKLLGGRERPSVMTHRATELSLGMAAEQLFDRLPAATRRELGGLPTIVRRLRDDAQVLRRRYDDLQEAINDAGDAASSAAYADVRDMRDTIKARLGDTVGALETIRLNLLRLHAGNTTAEGITTHLGVAAEVTAAVERLIAAHEEVEHTLRFPTVSEPTPV